LNDDEKDEKPWITYSNDRFGVSLQYPSDWLFDETFNTEMLDLHLNNAEVVSGQECPEGHAGLEIQVGLPKNSSREDFAEFVARQVIETHTKYEGLGPYGVLKIVKIGDRSAWQVEHSGWVSPCPGPGYFIEQDDEHYAFILTGSHDPRDPTLTRILQSVWFSGVSRL
jgi:hypothetical protein